MKAVVVIALVGGACASASEVPDAIGSSDAISSDAAAPSDGGRTLDGGGLQGGGTGFTTVRQMFDWVNQTRQQYSNHIPYDGFPFQGSNATSMTWALTFTWDDDLAREAQIEAQRLAGGQAPEGEYFPFQNDPNGEGFWITSLDAVKYKLSAKSDGNLQGTTGPFGIPEPPHKWNITENGMYRMAVAYQTGSGSFNHKRRLGVGAVDIANNNTWWVLLFGE